MSAALPHSKPTCLVLSVGGPQGLAHLGALQALKEEGVEVSCVVGNSMGSLIGALYAFDPTGDTTQHFRDLSDAYVERTEEEAGSSGLVFGILGALIGGPAGFAAGAALGAGSVSKINHTRLVSVLDEYVEQASIESLTVPFQTSYVLQRSEHLVYETVRSGNLSEAVGGSLANPFIFDDIDLGAGAPLDPGMDRVSAVPVTQACENFPGRGILAINVTADHAINPCSASEVMVHVPEASPADMLTNEEVRAAVIGSGMEATRAWLRTGAGRAFVQSARMQNTLIDSDSGRSTAQLRGVSSL